MAGTRSWKVIADVEVRQAPNPASALFFSASAGKVLKQAGKIIEFPGHGPRLPVLPRGWVDFASLQALDDSSAGDSSPGKPSTPSTAAPSSSAASGSAVSTPEACDEATPPGFEKWAGDRSWEPWKGDDGWTAGAAEDRGAGSRGGATPAVESWAGAGAGSRGGATTRTAGWRGGRDAGEAAPANDNRWTRDDAAAWREGSGWQVPAKSSGWDAWAGDAWASRDGNRADWEGAAAGATPEQDGRGAWIAEPRSKPPEEWEDELSVAANNGSSSPRPPISSALSPPKLGGASSLDIGSCNRSRTPDFGTPRKGAGAYRCLDPDGLNVRTGLELITPWVMSLPFGTIFQVSMRRKNSEGMVRLRTECGWTNEFGAPGGSMANLPVAERVLPPGAAEPAGIASSSTADAQEEAAPSAGTVSDGFDPASEPGLLFVGRLREGDGQILDCPEVSALFGVGGLQLDEAPPPWAQVPLQPLCFAMSLENGLPRVLSQSLRPVESGHRFAGKLKTVRRHPASEGREATGIGWISSLAGMHLYQKDIYIFLGKSDRCALDLSQLMTGDVLGFEIHVNAKGEPQASTGSVAMLKSHVAGRGGAVDATAVEIGRTMAVSYD